MKFYKYLYIGDTVKDPAKAKRKLKLHAGQLVYVIYIAQGNDQLEIFHSAYLKQKYYRLYPPVIVGIANNYDENSLSLSVASRNLHSKLIRFHAVANGVYCCPESMNRHSTHQLGK